MRNESRDLVVTVSDENRIDQAKQLFESARTAGRWGGAYMLLGYRLSHRASSWFSQRGILVRELDLPCPAEIYERINSGSRASWVSSLKYHLFGPEFRSWGTITQLDTDVIVAGPLRRIVNVGRFAAVPEMSYRIRHQFAPDRESQEILGSSAFRNLPSFNFGVFSLRPSALDSDIFDRLCEGSARLFPHALYLEQSVANYVLADLWETLPLRLGYNPYVSNRFGIASPVIFHPHTVGELVYHFYGDDKPWRKGHPFEALWRANLSRAEKVGSFLPTEGFRCQRRNALSFLCLELVIHLKKFVRVVRRLISDAAQKLDGSYRRIR